MTFRRGLPSKAVRALRELDLEVHPGQVVGVLGPNGSGKTTLLQVLSGTLRPTAGTVRVLGRAPTDRALVQRVGFQPEGPLPFSTLSARDFLIFIADMMELPAAEVRQRADDWLGRLGLTEVARRPLGTFSTGMTRRLALAAAMLADPEVLLLDEPTSGLDPHGSLAVRDLVQAAAARGAAVLMASHDLQEVEQVCDTVYLLSGGRCRTHGRLDDLLGTDAHAFVVGGLDEAGVARTTDAIQATGGEVLRVEREREHLFALYRRLEAERQ